MKITIISHNYSPENSGIGYYSTEMAEYLAKDNEVTVVTAFPYYPQWKIHEEYRDKPEYLKENKNGVEVLRYKMYTPEKPNFLNRIKQLISFYKGSLNNLKKIKETDVVIVVVPFTISIMLGNKLKKSLDSKLWVHIQDFEFDAAIDTGLLSSIPLMPKILTKMESKLLNKSDMNSTISYAMMDKLQSKSDRPISFFPNWINENNINPELAKPHKFMKEGKTNILYSGNIGAKQDWDSYIAVVESFVDRDDVHFVLVGDGAQKDEVVDRLKDASNFSYYEPVPLEELNDLLCSAGVHILLQKPEVVDTVMPSKLLGMMASEKPSFITGNENSEVKKHIDDAKAGTYLSTNEVDDIIKNLKEQINNLKDYDGKNARSYIIDHFAYEKVLSDFQEKLKAL